MNKFYKSPTIMFGLSLFLLLVIGTIYRIITAIETNPELVNQDAYNVGQNYGKDIAIANELKQQKYKITLEVEDNINYNQEHTYKAYFTKNDIILNNAKITASFYRQLEPEFDFTVDFVGNTIKTKLSRKGKWLLVIKAEIDDKFLYKYHNIYAY